MKIKNLSLIILVATIFIYLFSINEADPDIWGHLKFGQDIFTTLSVPRYDMYSYSSYGANWVNHEWLSELIFYMIFKFSGSMGLVLFKYCMGLVLTFLIYKSISINTKSKYLTLVFIALSLPIINAGFAIRPQIFTYLFFALVLFFIEKYENNQHSRALFILPLIFLLWVNLHGGFISGLGLVLLYCLYKLLNGKQYGWLVIVFSLSIAATLFNPYGIKIWNFILMAVSMQRPYITEWQKVKFSFEYSNYFLLVLIMMLGLVFSKISRFGYEILVLFIALFFSFQHNRHDVMFAIAALIYLPKHLDSFLGSWFMRFENRFSQVILDIVFVCLAGSFLIATLIRPTNILKVEVSQRDYPVEAINFLKINNIHGNIFCTFDWAQMCIKELSFKSRVFFDGRYETVYSSDLMRYYYHIISGANNFNDYLVRFPETDVMLLKKSTPLVKALSENKDWVLVYSTNNARVFLNNNSHNKSSIESHKNNRLLSPKMQNKYYLDDFNSGAVDDSTPAIFSK